MLQGFFNYDNPVWRFIGKLGDLVLLNLLWLVCCIPVFTAGAATTAVYYVTLKLVRDEDDSTIKSFFRSFIQNFKQATAIWLLILLAGSLVAFDLWFIMGGAAAGMSGTLKTMLTAVFGGMTLILLFITTYVFPLQARFYNTVKRTLFNAAFHVSPSYGTDYYDAGSRWLFSRSRIFCFICNASGSHAPAVIWFSADRICEFLYLHTDL